MVWAPMAVPLLLTVILYFLPGSVVLLGLGQRGLRVAAFAPLVSIGIISSLAVLYGKSHIDFSTTTILLGCSVIAAVLVGLRGLITLPRHQSFRELLGQDTSHTGHARTSQWRLAAATVAGLVVCVVVWIFSYAKPMRTPNNFPQSYDVPFHFSVIKFLVESNNGSSTTSALVDQTQGSSFYPAAWHDMVALVVKTTGTSIPIAVAASCTTILVFVWSLAIMAFTTQLLGLKPRWVFLSLSFSGLFQAFPYKFVSYGVLYSNLLSFALLPGFLALMVSIFSTRRSVEDLVCRILVILIAAVGIALAQPNSLFTIVVLLLPFMLVFLFQLFGKISVPGSRLLYSWISCLLLVAICVTTWLWLYHAPSLQRTVTFEWPPFQTDAQAIGTYVMSASNGGKAEYVMTLLVLVGIVTTVIRKKLAWVVASWALMGVLYTITTSSDSQFRMVLTGFWYHDSYRLVAAAPMMAIPLACIGLGWISDQLSARKQIQSIAQPTIVLVVLTLLVTVITGLSPSLRAQRATFHNQTALSPSWPLTQSEYDFLEQVSKIVPPGVGVANDPYDGSAFGYSLFGMNVYFKDYDANWIGFPTSDIDTVRRDLNRVSTDHEVCQVLAKRDVEYMVVLNMNAINNGSGVGVDHNNWTGLQITESTPGFRLLLNDDHGNKLYQITACKA